MLAVAASDRNNARAPFSQSGPFVGVAAPGIDMVSTVPVGGNCVDQGTSFAAPYVSGVAALIRAKHPEWSYKQVITQIEQTADRTKAGRDDFVGWGVIDPAAAVNDDTTAPSADGPKPDSVGPRATPPTSRPRHWSSASPSNNGRNATRCTSWRPGSRWCCCCSGAGGF